MKRRDFLKVSGCFIGAATLGGITSSCGDNDGGPDAGVSVGTYVFGQGVASGDPHSTSIVLWTRCVAAAGGADPVNVTAQVSTTDDFATLVLEQEMTATADSDHTLRLLVTGLENKTRYYYRFIAGADTSDLGRTLTAPASDDTAVVNLAWVSCQDYESHFFHAYRQMLDDDIAAGAADQIQFLVHLGDFIYETIGAGFQAPLDDEMEPTTLVDADGNPRTLAPFPDGGGVIDDWSFADKLDNYRHLYKQYLRDPDLREARARWPFITTWDDHEFSNDCWQTQANYVDQGGFDEAAQQRKVFANQAWFEFIPANLTDAEGVAGVPPEASDFAATAVADVAYNLDDIDTNHLITEQNNLAALGSITIYRSFRYGKNIELVVTDERSYRSDHAVPEELSFNNAAFFDQRNMLPFALAIGMDAGETYNGGNPPATIQGLTNTRQNSPPGTMLGAAQKAWWKATMSGSDANWKLWGNEVPLMRFFVPQGPVALLLVDRLMNCDAWDGYNHERNELMQHLLDNDIRNVVAITGDVHAHFAGLVMNDHEDVSPTPVVAEFIAAGISSNTLFSFFIDATRTGNPAALRPLVSYDSTPLGGTETFVENTNNLLINGSGSAVAASETHDITAINNAADPTINTHLRYVDTNAHGYGLMTVTPTEIRATLVTVERGLVDRPPSIKRTAAFTLPSTGMGGTVSLAAPTITGKLPFPLDLV